MNKQTVLTQLIFLLLFFLLAFPLFSIAQAADANSSLAITSSLNANVNAGVYFQESTPAYTIKTNGLAPWFEANNLPSGFFINRVTGSIYGGTDVPGSYSIPISVTSGFKTVTALLNFTIQDIEERKFTVTNLSSNANEVGSLPWAIKQANQSIIPARINFNINSSHGQPPYRIQLTDRLWINEQLTIDGTSQQGYTGSPLIQIDVNGYENAFTVLGPDQWHHGGNGSVFTGLQIFNFKANAIATQPGANKITIKNNYIGFYWDSAKNRWWRNFEATLSENQIQNDSTPIYNGYTQAIGIGIQSSDNLITGNVISGVHNGIGIGYDFSLTYDLSKTWGPACWNNVIDNNFIGTTPDGSQVLTNTSGATLYIPSINGLAANPFGSPNTWKYFGNNSDGIYLAALAKGTIISNNVSSGNFSAGVELLHESVERNQIYGNRLGLDVSGEYILPNGELGIILSNGAHNNVVGGSGGPNLISGNYFAGVELGGENSYRKSSYNTIQGNLIGCNSTCTKTFERQSVGIHIGTSESFLNVLAENTIVGNGWGIYVDHANANIISDNYIGASRTGLALGNSKSGIVIDHGEWNITFLNHIENNGYGIFDHDDWFFGLWDFNGNNNNHYDNYILKNRTATNKYQGNLPSSAVTYPTQDFFTACINLNGVYYSGYFTKLGFEQATSGTQWKLNQQSISVLPPDHIPNTCLQFTPEFGIESSNAFSLSNELQSINFKFIQQDVDPYGLYWQQR